MIIKQHQRCKYCGYFLFNADIDLPIEIDSTGAQIAKMDIDINCGHCHKGYTYSIGTKNIDTKENIKIDIEP